jgi:hypothetical protein
MRLQIELGRPWVCPINIPTLVSPEQGLVCKTSKSDVSSTASVVRVGKFGHTKAGAMYELLL